MHTVNRAQRRVLLGLALVFSVIVSPVVVAQTIGLVSHGNTLRLVEVSAGGMVEIDRFAFDRDEEFILLPHTIFDLQVSPTNGEVYVSSFNPCHSGNIGCWGNARIDRFRVTPSSIEHVGPAFLFDSDTARDGGAPGCTGENWLYPNPAKP